MNVTLNLVNHEKEITTLYRVLRKLNIHDIELNYDQNGLIAKDDDNVWHGMEFYEFLVNDAIVFDDNKTAIGIPDELLEDFKIYKFNKTNCINILLNYRTDIEEISNKLLKRCTYNKKGVLK